MTRVLIGIVGICWAAGAMAQDWPQWRGNQLNNVGPESSLPVNWNSTENVLWRVPLPGPAGSSPVVAGERVFVTSPDGDEIKLICISTAGEKLWEQTLGVGNRTVREDEGNSASPSPATDGQHVWAMDTQGSLACFTAAGEPVWKKSLQDDYGAFDIQFGMTSTPVLFQGKLYLQLIHGSMQDRAPSKGLVVALDAATGTEVWKHVRETDGTAENKHSYASPTVYQDNSGGQLIIHGADYVTAHDLADGHELWRCGNLNPREHYNPFLRFVASPTWTENLIVVPTAKRGPVVAIRPGHSGTITDNAEAIAWRVDRGTPDVPTPVVVDGLVYLCGESGTLTCLDAGSGEQIYLERTESDRYRASPVVAGGHLYLTSRGGVVTVVKLGRAFEVVARNEMQEPTTASPAIAGGRIYLRTFEALYAIGPTTSSSTSPQDVSSNPNPPSGGN